MSERWQGVLVGITVVGLLVLLLRQGGLFRWWRRRRYLVQLLVLFTIPLPLVVIIIAVSLLLHLPIEFVAGLLLGGVWAAIIPLLATCRVVGRLRGSDEADESENHPAL